MSRLRGALFRQLSVRNAAQEEFCISLYNRRRHGPTPPSAMHRVLTPADYRPNAVEERRRAARPRWHSSSGGSSSLASRGASASPTSTPTARSRDFRAWTARSCCSRGAGMRLDRRRAGARRARSVRAAAFSGDDAIQCALLRRSRRSDFNPMVRRADAPAAASIVVRDAGHRRRARRASALCYAAAGALECLLAGPCRRCDRHDRSRAGRRCDGHARAPALPYRRPPLRRDRRVALVAGGRDGA